jgi:hypothetical protein
MSCPAAGDMMESIVIPGAQVAFDLVRGVSHWSCLRLQ